jgi:hypothetical protein
MNMIPARITAVLACLLLVAGCESAPSPVATPSPALSPSSTSAVPFVASCPLVPGQRLSSPPRATLDSGPIRPNLFDFESVWDHRDGQGFRYKVPWMVAAEQLEVRVDRLDAPGTGKGPARPAGGDVDLPPGLHFFAGEVLVPAAGCWRVTATIPDGTSLSFIFRAG